MKQWLGKGFFLFNYVVKMVRNTEQMFFYCVKQRYWIGSLSNPPGWATDCTFYLYRTNESNLGACMQNLLFFPQMTIDQIVAGSHVAQSSTVDRVFHVKRLNCKASIGSWLFADNNNLLRSGLINIQLQDFGKNNQIGNLRCTLVYKPKALRICLHKSCIH